MNPKIIATILITNFLNFNASFGQEKIWTKQTKISEVIAFEKEINPNAKFLSQNVSLSKEYYPFVDKYKIANPIIVQRESLEYLPIYAEYFFSQPDSVLRLASYDWEKDRYGNFFEKQKIWKQEGEKLKIYNKEYDRIQKILLDQLGIPNTIDKKEKEVSSENGTYLTRNTLWETKEVHAELNMIFASTTYRIRLTLYWKTQ